MHTTTPSLPLPSHHHFEFEVISPNLWNDFIQVDKIHRRPQVMEILGNSTTHTIRGCQSRPILHKISQYRFWNMVDLLHTFFKRSIPLEEPCKAWFFPASKVRSINIKIWSCSWAARYSLTFQKSSNNPVARRALAMHHSTKTWIFADPCWTKPERPNSRGTGRQRVNTEQRPSRPRCR